MHTPAHDITSPTEGRGRRQHGQQEGSIYTGNHPSRALPPPHHTTPHPIGCQIDDAISAWQAWHGIVTGVGVASGNDVAGEHGASVARMATRRRKQTSRHQGNSGGRTWQQACAALAAAASKRNARASSMAAQRRISGRQRSGGRRLAGGSGRWWHRTT